MNKHTRIFLLISLGVSLMAIALPNWAQQSDEFLVIVNPSNPVGSMTAKDISRLFLKKRTRWESGLNVQPVDQKAGTTVREEFSRIVLGRSTDAVVSYWQTWVFSGRGSLPPEKSSDAEVIAYVKANPGAIGYVSSTAELGGVKVLEVST